MVAWTGKDIGLLNFVRFNPRAETWSEVTVSAVPVLNTAVKITDYGYREQQRAVMRLRETQLAKLRAYLPENVQEKARDYHRLTAIGRRNRTREQEKLWEDLNDWYRSDYAPEWEEAIDAYDRGAIIRARRIMRNIRGN